MNPRVGARVITVAALLLAALAPPRAVHAQTGKRSEVFVVATLYGRHAGTPAYGHDTLRAMITRIAPQIVVLDVSPRELREQSVHPGKAEYPEVIFPLVEANGWRAYPGEPDEPAFGEIVSRLSRSLETFRTEQPEAAAADKAHNAATYAALAEVWRTPADVNGALTDQLLAASRALQDRLAGDDVAEAWRLWNGHAATMVRRAVREHPGARVLVLIGVENAGPLRRTLAGDATIDVVDVEAWLRDPPHGT